MRPPEPGTEHHLTLKIAGGELQFIRRPMSAPAKDGTLAFLDGLTAKGNPSRRVALRRNGEWRIEGAKGFQPVSWTVCAEMEAAADGG